MKANSKSNSLINIKTNNFKHVIVIPDDAINELGWEGGQDLELNVKEGRLIIQTKIPKDEEGDKEK